MNDEELQALAERQPDLQVRPSTRVRHEAMLTALVTEQSRSQPRPWISRRLVVITAGVIALGGGGVGVATALGAFEQVPSDKSMANCYATLDMDDEESRMSFVIVLPAPGEDELSPMGDAAAAALTSCARYWSDGMLHNSPPYRTDIDPEGKKHPVPALVACVLETGQVGVFPGDAATCTQLQLPTALL